MLQPAPQRLDAKFKTEGKVLVEPSWLSIYGKDKVSAENLVPLLEEDNNSANLISSEIESDETKPPPRYTEATYFQLWKVRVN